MHNHDLTEAAYSDTLTYIAIGEDRDNVFGILLDGYPALESEDIRDIMADAYVDAIAQGVDTDDVGEGW